MVIIKPIFPDIFTSNDPENTLPKSSHYVVGHSVYKPGLTSVCMVGNLLLSLLLPILKNLSQKVATAYHGSSKWLITLIRVLKLEVGESLKSLHAQKWPSPLLSTYK